MEVAASMSCSIVVVGLGCVVLSDSQDVVQVDASMSCSSSSSPPSESGSTAQDGGPADTNSEHKFWELPEGVPRPAERRPPKTIMSSAFNKHSNNDHGVENNKCSTPDVGQHSSESSEDFSDISEDSDIFNLCVEPKKGWTTEQDVDLTYVQYIAGLLRDDPLVPADPEDVNAEFDWKDVHSGAALPRAHCAFRGFEQDHFLNFPEMFRRWHVDTKRFTALRGE